MSTLICKKIRFYSEGDETSFFNWINGIQSVSDIKGTNDEIHLTIEDDVLSDESLRELIGVFTRYKIDLSQLSKFKSVSNEEWFYDNKTAFWHEEVFGKDHST